MRDETGISRRLNLENNGGLSWLREKFDLCPSQLYCLNFLIRSDQGGACFPTQKTIAFETGIALETVRDSLKGLERKGLITRVKREYRDRRNRLRKGKIHHYQFSDDVLDAEKIGYPDNPLPNSSENHDCIVVETTTNSGGNHDYIVVETTTQKEVKKEENKEEVESRKKIPETAQPDPPTASPVGEIQESGEGVQSMEIREEDATAPVSLERDVLPDSPGKPASSGDQSVAIRSDNITGFIQEDRAERLRRSRQLRRI